MKSRFYFLAKVLLSNLGLFVFFWLPAHAAPNVRELAFTAEWLALVHYQPQTLGGYVGLADGPGFYLAAEGKKDPLAELNATIEKLAQDPRVACLFPARAEFIQKKLGIKTALACPDFDEWIQKLDAESVSLVFSSAYPNNPASMFGHTLLRLNSRKKNDLLSYAVTYGANAVPSAIGIDYIFNGLFGGYQGYFSLAPYYVRVNEYSNTESRDLWEYELALTADETLFLQKHLWELYSNTWFDYYFIDENCSYLILALLDAVKPEWKLMQNHKYYILPGNSVRKISQIENAIKSVHHRESSQKRLLAKWNALNAEQTQEANQILEGTRDVSDASTLNASALDTSIDTLQYRKFSNHQKLEPQDEKKLMTLLRLRSKSSAKPFEPASFRSYNQPNLGLLSSRVSIGASAKGASTNSMLLGIRSGLHEFLENDAGYEPYSDMTFMAARISIGSKAKLSDIKLRELRLLESLSLTPWSSIDPKLAWGVKSRIEQPAFCESCLVGQLEIRGGPVWSVFGDRLRMSPMMHGGILVGGVLSRGYSLVPGFSMGFWSALSNRIHIESNFAVKRLLLSTIQNSQTIKQIEIGLGYTLGTRTALKASYVGAETSSNLNSRYEVEWGYFF